MAKKFRVAIIGCGTIAHSAHIPNYLKNEEVEITYFCDIIPERADEAVKKYGRGKAVYDYHEILGAEDIDVVSVCTHNDFHPVVSIDFMRAGKDVLCEKPAAKTLDEVLAMQKTAQETGRMLSIGVCNRFGTAVNKIKDLIDNGDLGEVYHVYTAFRRQRSIPGLGGCFTRKESAGGGVLIDTGVHYLDLILYCLGEPKLLAASGKAYNKIGWDIKNYVYSGGMWAEHTADFENGVFDVDDAVTGLIRTEGATISFNGAWAQNIAESENYIDFLGTKAGVRLAYCGNFKFYHIKDGMLMTSEPAYNTKDFYEEEIKSFLESTVTREPNRASIDHFVPTAKILQGIYDSSDQNREVAL